MPSLVLEAVNRFPFFNQTDLQVNFILLARCRGGELKVEIPSGEDGINAVLTDIILHTGSLRPAYVRQRLGVSYPTARKHIQAYAKWLGLPNFRHYQHRVIQIADMVSSHRVRFKLKPPDASGGLGAEAGRGTLPESGERGE
jgi:hypothetical protein